LGWATARVASTIYDTAKEDAMDFLAFVLINVRTGKLNDALRDLGEVKEVDKVYPTTGPFDVIALVAAPTLGEVRRIVTEIIHCIKAVERTINSLILNSLKPSLGRRFPQVVGAELASALFGLGNRKGCPYNVGHGICSYHRPPFNIFEKPVTQSVLL
jgi:hypothetical protein